MKQVLNRLAALLVLAAFLLSSLPVSGTHLSVHQDFDSGSIDVANTTFWGDSVYLRGRDNSNSGKWKWIYFRIDGAQGRELRFEIGDNFAPNSGRLTDLKMVYSYDNENWEFFDVNTWDSNAGTFTFHNNHASPSDSMWVAYSFPYPVSRSEAHLARISSSPYVAPTTSADSNFVLGQTAGGTDDSGRTVPPHNLYGYHLTDFSSTAAKTDIVLISGVHANEVTGTHTFEGLIDWLLSDDPRAAALRYYANFYVYPMVNPDGRYAGNNRGNIEHPSLDPNRGWDENAIEGGVAYQDRTEIYIIAEAMKVDTGGSADFLMDLHSWVAPYRQHFTYINDGTDTTTFWQSVKTLEPSMEAIISNGSARTTRWFGKNRLGAFMSMVQETTFRPDEYPERYYSLGENFGISWYEHIAAGKPPPPSADAQDGAKVLMLVQSGHGQEQNVRDLGAWIQAQRPGEYAIHYSADLSPDVLDSAISLSQEQMELLNSYELIIMPRRGAGSSGNFASTDWNNVRTPILNMNPFTYQSGNWDWVPSGTSLSSATNIQDLIIADASNRIFDNVTSSGGAVTMYVSPDATLQAEVGSSIFTGNVVGWTDRGGASNLEYPWLVTWDGTEDTFYNGGSQGLGGRRTLFLAETSNSVDLYTSAGQDVFLNAIAETMRPRKRVLMLVQAGHSQEESVRDMGAWMHEQRPGEFRIDYSADLSTDVLDSASSLSAAQMNVLNSYDLIIMPRSGAGSSGKFASGDWNDVSTPILNMNPFTYRDSNWGWIPAGTETPTTPGIQDLVIADTSHRVFHGLDVAGGSLQVYSSPNGTMQADVDSSLLTGRVAGWTDRTNEQYPWVVTWNGTEPSFYTGGTEGPGGPRTLFLGVLNNDLSACTDAGQQLLINAISQAAGKPREILMLVQPGHSAEQSVRDLGAWIESSHPGKFVVDYSADLSPNVLDSATSLSSAQMDLLNSYHLIIMPRTGAGASTNYGTTDWNDVTTPILNMNPFMYREDRWNWVPGTDGPNTPEIQEMVVVDSGSPLFHRVNTAGGSFDMYYAPDATMQAAVDSSLLTGNVVGWTDRESGGTSLAYPWLVVWDGSEGAFYNGGSDAPAGRRVLLLGETNNAVGKYTSAGQQILLNVIETVAETQELPSVMTWPTASAISYGQPLGASVLTGGTATVEGSFRFANPDIYPPAGSYRADVIFEPSEAGSPEVGSVSVSVNEGVSSNGGFVDRQNEILLDLASRYDAQYTLYESTERNREDRTGTDRRRQFGLHSAYLLAALEVNRRGIAPGVTISEAMARIEDMLAHLRTKLGTESDPGWDYPLNPAFRIASYTFPYIYHQWYDDLSIAAREDIEWMVSSATAWGTDSNIRFVNGLTVAGKLLVGERRGYNNAHWAAGVAELNDIFERTMKIGGAEMNSPIYASYHYGSLAFVTKLDDEEMRNKARILIDNHLTVAAHLYLPGTNGELGHITVPRNRHRQGFYATSFNGNHRLPQHYYLFFGAPASNFAEGFSGQLITAAADYEPPAVIGSIFKDKPANGYEFWTYTESHRGPGAMGPEAGFYYLIPNDTSVRVSPWHAVVSPAGDAMISIAYGARGHVYSPSMGAYMRDGNNNFYGIYQYHPVDENDNYNNGGSIGVTNDPTTNHPDDWRNEGYDYNRFLWGRTMLSLWDPTDDGKDPGVTRTYQDTRARIPNMNNVLGGETIVHQGWYVSTAGQGSYLAYKPLGDIEVEENQGDWYYIRLSGRSGCIIDMATTDNFATLQDYANDLGNRYLQIDGENAKDRLNFHVEFDARDPDTGQLTRLRLEYVPEKRFVDGQEFNMEPFGDPNTLDQGYMASSWVNWSSSNQTITLEREGYASVVYDYGAATVREGETPVGGGAADRSNVLMLVQAGNSQEASVRAMGEWLESKHPDGIAVSYSADLSPNVLDSATSLSQSQLALLNSYDLIIMPRIGAGSSGNFASSDWNLVSTPILNMNPFTYSDGDRWGWVPAGVDTPSSPDIFNMVVVDPLSRVLHGVNPVGGEVTMYNQATTTMQVDVDSSLLTGDVVGVTDREEGGANLLYPWVVTWDGTEESYYDGGTEAPAGRRTLFLGAMNNAVSDYTADGQQLLLNAVFETMNPRTRVLMLVQRGHGEEASVRAMGYWLQSERPREYWVDYSADLSIDVLDSASTLNQGQMDLLNSYDLIVMPRIGAGASSNFASGDWNDVSTPILNMNPFTYRDSNWGWIPAGTETPNTPEIHDMVVVDSNSFLFHGLDTSAGNIPVYATPNATMQADVDSSVFTGQIVGVTDRQSGGANALYPWLVTWNGTEGAFYSGSTAAPAGRRTLFLGVNANEISDYTEEGRRLLLNVIAQTVRQPTPLLVLVQQGHSYEQSVRAMGEWIHSQAPGRYLIDYSADLAPNVLDSASFLSQDQMDLLHRYSLIIMPRMGAGSSGNFASADWNQVATPILNMNPFTYRDTNWGWVPAGTDTPTLPALRDMIVADPANALLRGIRAASGSFGMYHQPEDMMQVHTDSSLITGTLVGWTDRAEGGVHQKDPWLVAWDGTESAFYTGGAQSPGGPRILLLGATGNQLKAHTAAGRKVLLNAIAESAEETIVTEWPVASSITYGDSLNESQLSGGSANVSGSFAFADPSVEPGAGTYTADVAFTPDDASYDSVAGTVGVTVEKATPVVSAWPSATSITYGDALSASNLSGGSADTPGSFAFTNPSTTPDAGIYSATVTFTPSDTDNYDTVGGSVGVTVEKATPVVSAWPSASSITYGDSLSASSLSGGSADTPGTFAFTNPSTTPDAGTYSASVTFTPSDTGNYNSVGGSVDVTVEKATPVVSAWPSASSITYGDSLSASNLSGGSADTPGSFAFTNPSTTPDAGTYSASVTFTPSDTGNYNSVGGSVDVTVEKATPVVSDWPDASSITYGEALSASTLIGGSASVSGSFDFMDPLIEPEPGIYTASVIFTPTDSSNYESVVGSVQVLVNGKRILVLVAGGHSAEQSVRDFGAWIAGNRSDYLIEYSADKSPDVLDSASSLSASQRDLLNSYDLILMPRYGVGASSNFASTDWNDIATPLLLMNPFMVAEGTRWGWVPSGTATPSTPEIQNMVVVDGSSPLFNGVNTSGGSFAVYNNPDGTMQVDVLSSALTAHVAGWTDREDGGVNEEFPWVATWDASESAFYSGGSEAPGGLRTLFLGPVSNDPAEYTADGQQFLLNVIAYTMRQRVLMLVASGHSGEQSVRDLGDWIQSKRPGEYAINYSADLSPNVLASSISLSQSQMDLLNSYDLIVMPRYGAGASSDFASTDWNNVITPILNMNPFTYQDSNWGWIPSGVVTPTSDIQEMVVVDGTSEVLDGVTASGGTVAIYNSPTATMQVDAVSSIFTGNVIGWTDREDAGVNEEYPWLVIWNSTGEAFYSGGAQTPAGPRTLFLGELSNDPAVYTSDGQQLLLNLLAHTIVQQAEGGAAPVSLSAEEPESLDGYSQWRQSYFDAVALESDELTGPLADYSGDGSANLLSYAMGLDPRGSIAAQLPRVSVMQEEDGDYLAMTIYRSNDALDITVVVEVSDDMRNWLDEVILVEQTVVGEKTRLVFRDLNRMDLSGARFMRMRVEID